MVMGHHALEGVDLEEEGDPNQLEGVQLERVDYE